MLKTDDAVSFRWADAADDPFDIAQFFIKNAPRDYISHGEIQDGRAKGVDTWSENLASILVRQFSLARDGQADESYSETRLALAFGGAGTLAGIGYIGINHDAPSPFAVIYDLLIQADMRCRGVGSGLLAWIEEKLRMRQIKFIFLESGVRNNRAHAFFGSSGFIPVSLNFMKTL